jgi:hypothetical protein
MSSSFRDTPSSRVQRSSTTSAPGPVRTVRLRPLAESIERTERGAPLDSTTRRTIEAETGADLGGTTVHRASSLPGALGAAAFAYGSRIFLGPGQEGALAHESRHVAQQRLGRVRPTTTLAGLAANFDPALERAADSGEHVAWTSAATAVPTLQAKWRSVPSAERPGAEGDVVEDLDTHRFFVVLRYTGEPGEAEVREINADGVALGPLLHLQINPDWSGELRAMDAAAIDDAAMDTDESLVDDTQLQFDTPVPPFVAAVQTPAQDAEQQLIDQGMRLARLVTGFNCQVEVAPITEGRRSADDMSYTPNQLMAVRVMVGNERPDTYLEPKKGKSNIPQGKHTVAWALMRRWLESMAGRSVRDVLVLIATRLQKELYFVTNLEGEMLETSRFILTPEVRSAQAVVEHMCTQPMRIHVWQRYASELMRVYAQIHHQSVAATVAGSSKQRGEAPAVATLRACEDALAAGEEGVAASLITTAATNLIEVNQNMDGEDYAAAVAQWIELLVDAYPRVMEKYGAGALQQVLGRKLGKRYLSITGAEKDATVAQLLLHFGHAVPEGFGPAPARPVLPATRLIARHESESQLGNFVGNVAVSPRQNTAAEARPSHEGGPTVRWEKYSTLEVFDLTVSDDDRPKTKYKQHQQSHTVAWTLWRHELTSFRNRPVTHLLAYLRDELRALEGDVPNPDFASLRSFALGEVERIEREDPAVPLHMWQADLSRLVTWYAHIHQRAASSTYHDPRTSRASGHGEATHMDVLRRVEQRLYESNESDAPKDRIVEAAIKLFDVHGDMAEATVKKVLARWERMMRRSFPMVMAQFWPSIRIGALACNVNTEQQPVRLDSRYPNAPTWLT